MKRSILAVILLLSAVFGVHGQNSGPMDIILLLDTSSGMSSSNERVNNYITGAFLSEFLRIGDTFHLIAFSESPRLDVVRRVQSRGDLETIIGRILIQYPVESGSNIGAALSYTENYIGSLPERPKKIVIVSTGDSGTNALVSAARQRLGARDTTLDFTQVTPGQPLANLPSSSRPPAAPARAATTTPATQPASGTAAQTQQPSGTTPSAQPTAGTTAQTQQPTGTTPSAQPTAGTTVQAQQPGGTTPSAQPASGTSAQTQQPGGTTPSAQPTAGTTPSAQPTAGTTAQAQQPGGTTPSAQPTVGTSAQAQQPGGTTSVTQPGGTGTSEIQTLPAGETVAQTQQIDGSPALPGDWDTALYTGETETSPAETQRTDGLPTDSSAGEVRQDLPEPSTHTPAASARDRRRASGTGFVYSRPLIIGGIIGLLLLLLLIIILATRRLGSRPNRVMASVSAAKPAREETPFVDHSRDLASYAAVQNRQRVTPYSDRPLKQEVVKPAVINPAGPLLLNLFVEDQNTSIGKRNIHSLKSGFSLNVGGRKSDDFLIFLVPIPKNIGEIRRNGSQLTFIPRKPKYFPDIGSSELKDCINKTIRIVSDKNYEVRFRFEMYEDPLIALNRMLHSVKVPL